VWFTDDSTTLLLKSALRLPEFGVLWKILYEIVTLRSSERKSRCK